MFIKELPYEERPREKMIACGTGMLSNSELLAILIGTGTRNKSSLRLAEEILSMQKGILFLTECTPEELASIKGIGIAKSCQILAAIELGKRISTIPREKKPKINSPETIAALFMEEMRYYKKEVFNVLMINTKGEIVGVDKTSVGDLCSTVIHPREVFLSAIKRSAAAVVFVHNHPSGDPAPSQDDIMTTNKLLEAAKILGIQVWDHVIIGDGKYISFREEQLI